MAGAGITSVAGGVHSAHLSLAVLEILVHVPAEEDLPTDLVTISADVPDDLGSSASVSRTCRGLAKDAGATDAR